MPHLRLVPALILGLTASMLSAVETVTLTSPWGSQTWQVSEREVVLVPAPGAAPAQPMAARAAQAGLAVAAVRDPATGGTVVTLRPEALAAQSATVDRAAVAVVRPAGGQAWAALYAPGSDSSGPRAVLTRSVMVRLIPGSDIQAVMAGLPGTVLRLARHDDRTWIIKASEDRLLAAVDLAVVITKRPGVEYAEPVIHQPLVARGTPNDPLYSQQYHVGDVSTNPASVNTAPVWNFVTGKGLGAGVVVNVVDCGVETHPDFGTNLRQDLGYSFREGQQTQLFATGETDSHGTYVAGLIAEAGSNSIGGVGVAPSATLIPVQLIGSSVLGHIMQADDSAAALSYGTLATLPSWVSNNSYGVMDNGIAFFIPSASKS